MNSDFSVLLNKLAAREHTTPEYIYRKMEEAIQAAFAHRNDSPQTRAAWARIGYTDKVPSPEQFLGKLTALVRKELDLPQ